MWSLILVAGFVCGQVPAKEAEDLPGRVAGLVRQLDDDRVATRQAAEAALLDLGPDALELLPAADAPLSAEVRERIARIRQQLQIQHARRALEASRVTLDGEMALAAALEALEKQTGNAFVGYEDLQQRITVDVRQKPFWEALDQLLDQAHLRVDPFGSGGGLSVVDAPTPRAARVAYAGLFRFEPTLVTAVRDLRDPSMASLRVRLLIMWESRTTPIFLSQPLSEVTAVDQAGEPIAVASTRGTLTASVESDLRFVEMELPFALPDRSAQRIAALRGNLDVMLPGPVERFEFKGLADAREVEQRKAGVTVTFRETRANDETFEMQIYVAFADPGNALESHRGWIYRNNAYLVDADGNRVACGGQRVVSQEPDAVGMVYLFAVSRPLSDYSFVYETPSLVMRRSVPYELKDIDLP